MKDNKLHYVLSHAAVPLAVCMAVVLLLTLLIADPVNQLQSTDRGVSMLLIDVSLSMGNSDQLVREFKKATGMRYVMAKSVVMEDVTSYVRSVENYTEADYLRYLVLSRNTELIFFPAGEADTVMALSDLLMPLPPVFMEEEQKKPVTRDGTLFAYPAEGRAVTAYGATLIGMNTVYAAVVRDADHAAEAKAFLSQIIYSGEE